MKRIIVQANEGNHTVHEPLIDKKQLSPLIGLSVRSIDNRMKAGQIPFIKWGRTVRFRYSDVLSHLENFRNG